MKQARMITVKWLADTGTKGSLSAPAPMATSHYYGIGQRTAFFAIARLRQLLPKWVAKEQRQFIVWASACFACGIAAQFAALGFAQTGFAMLATILAFVGAVVFVRMRPIYLLFLAFGVGFLVSAKRDETFGKSVFIGSVRNAEIVGHIDSVEMTRIQNGMRTRLIIRPKTISLVTSDSMPRRIRMTLSKKHIGRLDVAGLPPGQPIKMFATLRSTNPAGFPGGYDQRANLSMRKIDATGFATGPVTLLAHTEQPASLWIQARHQIWALRKSIAQRILAAAPSDNGAVVAAIVTGLRSASAPQDIAAMRDSGLAHLIAISGLHMGLATGTVFFALRAGLALFPSMVLRYPIKKWAAIGALISGVLYLLISGASWSALRACIMVSVSLIAILLDRRAISMRNVAIAAALILAIAPEAILQPGFQMSFAAVIALVRCFEIYRARRSMSVMDMRDTQMLLSKPHRWLLGFRKFAIGVGLTDLIASSATAAFAYFHFQRLAVFSLPANLIASPIMGLLVMPLIVLAMVLMPVGLDQVVWRAAAYCMGIILDTAHYFAGIEGAVKQGGFMPSIVLALIVVGAGSLLLATTPLRWFGVIALVCVPFFWMQMPKPLLLVLSNGASGAMNVLMYDAQSEAVAALAPRRNKFVQQQWAQHVGVNKLGATMLDAKNDCSEKGCEIQLPSGGPDTQIVTRHADLAQACRTQELVIALFTVRDQLHQNCDAALIDQRALYLNGSHQLEQRGREIFVRHQNGTFKLIR